MKSMTAEEARSFCTQESTSLAVDEHNSLYYDSPEEYSFFVKHPPGYRGVLALTHDILTLGPPGLFEGGLVWLKAIWAGTDVFLRPGWRILEDMRRAHGDLRTLDIAPAQHFRHDEFVELHVFLIQVMAYGWPACYVPSRSGFFLQFRSSERFFCYSKDAAVVDEFFSKLARWSPVREEAQTT
jgi:hypothetical protein